MVNKLNQNNKYVYKIAVPLVVLLFVIILGYRYDFFYALNDDTGIRDLLSGNYTGRPEAHCMQLMYPLAVIFAGLYTIVPQLPWFGLALLAGNILVIMGIGRLIVNSILCTDNAGREETPEKKNLQSYLFTVVLIVAVIIIIALKEIIFIQYTLCSASVCIYIVADIMLSKKGEEGLLLDGICYLYALSLREEMGLLMIPFIGLSIYYKCDLSIKEIFTKRWIIYILATFIGMTALFGIDKVAYSGEWGAFRDFFNARTEVYDYTGIPDYEENEEFYEVNNISKNQYELLKSYNFALDESIDTNMLINIGNYARQKSSMSLARKIYTATYAYFYDMLHGWELAFILLIWTGYVFLYKLSFDKKDFRLFIKTSLILLLRNMIWIYMYFLGRQGGLADRITHALFFVELLMLVALLISDNVSQRWKFRRTFCIISVYACVLIMFFIGQIKSVGEEHKNRKTYNSEWDEFRFCAARAEGYYYIDVYDTVNFSEEIFSTGQSNLRNYEIAGGWIAKSPAFYEKARLFGFDTPRDGIESGKAHFLEKISDINGFPQEKVKE